MTRFIIHEGLPYSYVDGKTYSVRWDEKGFTVGAEVDLTSAPPETFEMDWPEISILAKCRNLDSIGIDGEAETEEITEILDSDNIDADDIVDTDEAESKKGEVEAIQELEKMTVAELKQFASDNNIEIQAKNKAELIEEIKIALKAVI